MEFRQVGNSGLKVSEIGLGGNNFGGRLDEAASARVIHHALDMGINFIDTAELYERGRSEECIGKAVKGRRAEVVIASKFGMPPSIKPDSRNGSRGYIMAAAEGSLKRLGTDYIDLYYMHWPDPATPIEETLRALEELVKGGKVRHIAASNFAAWQLSDALCVSNGQGLASFVALESRYNLIFRELEGEAIPCCRAHGVSVIPWGPLGGGFLTGKYRRGREIPTDTRLATSSTPSERGLLTEANFDRLERLEAFAAERGHRVNELAVAWLLSKPYVASVIAGAMSPEQLAANAAGAAWRLTGEDTARLDEV